MIEEHPEPFGVNSDLFTSEILAKQYASMCAIEWLSIMHLAPLFKHIELPSLKDKRAAKSATFFELYDRLMRGSSGVSNAEMKPSTSSSEALSWTNSGLRIGEEVVSLTVPAIAKLEDSKDLAIGGSFTPLYPAVAVDSITPIVRSAPMDPSARLQQPARRFQVVEYRPRITGYPMVFDKPTLSYAKAGN